MAPALEAPIRHIRAYSVQFLEKVRASERGVPRDAGDRYLYDEPQWHMNDYFFGEALGELRSAVAYQAGVIASRYEIDIEDELEDRPQPRGSFTIALTFSGQEVREQR